MPKRVIKIDTNDIKSSMREETEFLRSTLIHAWNGRDDRIGMIAESAGVCEQTVRRYIWSQTRNPNLLTFVGIATALGFRVALIQGNRMVKLKKGKVEAVKRPRKRRTPK